MKVRPPRAPAFLKVLEVTGEEPWVSYWKIMVRRLTMGAVLNLLLLILAPCVVSGITFRGRSSGARLRRAVGGGNTQQQQQQNAGRLTLPDCKACNNADPCFEAKIQQGVITDIAIREQKLYEIYKVIEHDCATGRYAS